MRFKIRTFLIPFRTLVALLAGAIPVAIARGENAPVRFAVIGDFGSRDERERAVADLVKGWKPDFIVTVGDNAYSKGNDAFKTDVVDYFGDFIRSPAQDPDATRTRFFPALGNHDIAPGKVFDPTRLDAYRATFALPAGGDGRYYEFVRGPVHFFALDSDPPALGWDGTNLGSKQEVWFRGALKKAAAARKESWFIAYFHHSPYHSSTNHTNDTWMRAWKLEDAGLTAVMTGHEHHYERVMRKGTAFFVDGTGGAGLYPIDEQHLVEGSVVHYPASPTDQAARGALLVEADVASIGFKFIDLQQRVIDQWSRAAVLGVKQAQSDNR